MLRRTLLLGGLAALAAPSVAGAAAGPRPAERLDGPRMTPTGRPQFLVVLLHGSGGDGPNMWFLSEHLPRYLPTAAFASPTGPFPREDIGYRWFPGAVAGDPLGMVMRGMREGGPVFDRYIQAELARYQLGPDRLFLLGFSQGSMMALNWGLRQRTPPAGIIAFAGLTVATDGLPARLPNPPPVLISQGSEDGNGAQRVEATRKLLTDRGVAVQAHVVPGIGHTIDSRGIRFAGEFLQSVVRAKAG
jgi:phospholipase/carboxylesterase